MKDENVNEAHMRTERSKRFSKYYQTYLNGRINLNLEYESTS